MSTFSKRTILVFLVYLAISIGLTLLALRKESRTPAPPPKDGVQVTPPTEIQFQINWV